MEAVDIYANRGAMRFVVLALKVAAVLVGLGLLGQALFSGDIGMSLALGLALVGGGVLADGPDFVKYLEKRPQLSLFADGFVDHRRPLPVVVPWDHIRAVRMLGGAAGKGWSLELVLTDGGRGIMLVPGRGLATTPDQLVAEMKRFAPRLAVTESRAA